MKIKLIMGLNEKDLLDTLGKEKMLSNEDLKEELEQMLFEVCEDWVLKGAKPDLEFTK